MVRPRLSLSEAFVVEVSVARKERTRSLFWAHSRWDVIPAACGFAHLAYVVFLFFAFRALSWWALIPLGLVYSVSISWNINGVSHNFLHNRFFRWVPLGSATRRPSSAQPESKSRARREF